MIKRAISIFSIATLLFSLPQAIFSQERSEPTPGKIIYTHLEYGEYIPGPGEYQHLFYINSMNPDGTNDQTIGGPLQISDVSPDGKKVLGQLYNKKTQTVQVVIANLDGSKVKFLADGERAKFSGDGKKIAFVRSNQQNGGWYGDIFVMNVNGSNIKQVTNTSDDEDYVDINYDGTEVLYHSGDSAPGTGHGYYAYLMNIDGTNRRLLNDNENILILNPTYSPDGSQIAYQHHNQTTFETDIYTMNVDGTNRVNRTPHIVENVQLPIWSYDGSALAFRELTSYEIPNKMYIMNLDGSNLHTITSEKLLNTPVGWIK